MPKDPLVTVVIAAYNCSKWIEKTVSDVLGQTYSNLELLVVDDGSTDQTEATVKNIKDPRLSYFKLDQGSGSPAKPRNVGLNKSKGEFITFLDHDDRWYPDRMAKVLKVFGEKPEIDLVCHDEVVVCAGKTLKRNKYGPFSEQMYLDMMLSGNRVSTSAATVRTETARKVGGFNEERSYFLVEDFDFWMKLAKSGSRFYYLHEVLGEYTIHSENWTRNIDYNYRQNLQYIHKQIELYPETLDSYRDRILGHFEYSFARNYQQLGMRKEALAAYLRALRFHYVTPQLIAGWMLAGLGIKC